MKIVLDLLPEEAEKLIPVLSGLLKEIKRELKKDADKKAMERLKKQYVPLDAFILV